MSEEIFKSIKTSTQMPEAKYHTHKAITAMLLLAQEYKGVIEENLLSSLFDFLKINTGGRQRALAILDAAFRAGDGVYYIPRAAQSTISTSRLVYTATKSREFRRETILSFFVDDVADAKTYRGTSLALENVTLQRANAELEAKHEKVYQDWEEAVEERDKFLAKSIDLSNRLTRAQVEASKFQKSFTEIIQGMLAKTEDDEDSPGHMGVPV